MAEALSDDREGPQLVSTRMLAPALDDLRVTPLEAIDGMPVVDSGLTAQSTYDHPLTTVPSDDRSDLGISIPFVGHAWHIGVVEVGVETSKSFFLRYAAVHDAGTVVNPGRAQRY